MGLSLNAAEARKADNFSTIIRETGRYVGVITRAEKLSSQKGTVGVGFSFKSDDGATANYLDVYTEKANGEQLWGHAIVQSILCCTRVKNADEGPITFEKWTRDQGIVETTATGYPALMGKRIGLVLQRVLETNQTTGADVDRVNIARVFEAATGLTSSEILDGKTKPEKIDAMMKSLQPVWDRRKKSPAQQMASQPAATGDHEFDSEIPF